MLLWELLCAAGPEAWGHFDVRLRWSKPVDEACGLWAALLSGCAFLGSGFAGDGSWRTCCGSGFGVVGETCRVDVMWCSNGAIVTVVLSQASCSLFCE